ncbi:MAG: HlyD family efflux transporter periplasmic adaptor subunit [Candidatus Devosia euplotis]|nr:HlyD family efflux transporter periplasmic adaptor subunit [Candidatus Devosia euplotis]
MTGFLAGIPAMLMAIPPGSTPDRTGYTGYLEADYVYVAPASGGRITDIAATEGQAVTAGQVLFALGDLQQRALLDAAETRAAPTRATLDNLVTGSRRQEIDMIRASLSKAQSDLELAQSNLSRREKLLALGNVPEMRVEQDRAARNAQQEAAEANLTAAQADARQAALNLADCQTRAPIDGLVDRLFFNAGEMAAGTPAVSILPKDALKARFFVPEADRAALALGETVHVGCDGCSVMEATITYLAATPQTTPPVIYSRQERGRLVYLAEAELAALGTLQPGQPVTVTR